MALSVNYFALGTAPNGTSASINAVTEDNTANVGDLVSILTCVSSGLVLSDLYDDVGNTYTIRDAFVNGTDRYYWCDTVVTNAMPPGTTITADYSGSAGRKGLVAVVIYGADANPFDQQGTGAAGTSTSPSITTGTLSQANSIILGGLFVTSPVATVTEDADYSTVDGTIIDNRTLRVSARIVNSTAVDTFNPTLGASQAWAVNYIVYKAAGDTPPPEPSSGTLPLLGVG